MAETAIRKSGQAKLSARRFKLVVLLTILRKDMGIVSNLVVVEVPRISELVGCCHCYNGMRLMFPTVREK
jgi:hypothetical protein